MTYKTPDVYVEEISLFPPSVAEVETAVPAFIGYTEKAIKNGVDDVTKKPTRITSLKEYEEIFGGAPEVDITKVTLDSNCTVTDAQTSATFYMYDALRLFFNNGGGKCYIVSIGSYQNNKNGKNLDHFTQGIDELKKQDEPTIILFPDAVLLEDSLYAVQQHALKQCANLMDRVVILDLLESPDWKQGYEQFRTEIGINNLKYGAAYTPYLKTILPKKVQYMDIKGKLVKKEYGQENPVHLIDLTDEPNIREIIEGLDESIADADVILESINAYIKPFQVATIKEEYYKRVRDFKIEVKKALDKLKHDPPEIPSVDDEKEVRRVFRELFIYIYNVAEKLVDEWAQAKSISTQPNNKLTNKALINTIRKAITNRLKAELTKLNKNNNTETEKYVGNNEHPIEDIYLPVDRWNASDDQNNNLWGDIFTNVTLENDFYGDEADTPQKRIENMRRAEPQVSAVFNNVDSIIIEISDASDKLINIYETSLASEFPLFKKIIDKVASSLTNVPPSGAIAGVYATVDRMIGVWKSPANVSLNSVKGLTWLIDREEQDELNVDVIAGKSINAIRPFTGRGILVWGARTLAGNDNEWRYISVRRFFNMVEESVKKSTYWAVFEPNDANTWIRVKSMIENYLTQKWRDGALAGAKPDEAFFVKVGLGITMTAQDILEGRMNVEIGMAVVRPAEFIILKFSHKMQTS